jgi:hypothetical protein
MKKCERKLLKVTRGTGAGSTVNCPVPAILVSILILSVLLIFP